MIAVVFPQPGLADQPSVSPSRMSKLMPSTACTLPTRRRSTAPLVKGYSFTRSRTSSTVAALARGNARRALAAAARRREDVEALQDRAARSRRCGGRPRSGAAPEAGIGQQVRLDLDALLDAHRAPGHERTARRQVDERRRSALDRRQRLPFAEIQPRHRSEQAERVRHPRAIEHVVDRARSRPACPRTSRRRGRRSRRPRRGRG